MKGDLLVNHGLEVGSELIGLCSQGHNNFQFFNGLDLLLSSFNEASSFLELPARCSLLCCIKILLYLVLQLMSLLLGLFPPLCLDLQGSCPLSFKLGCTFSLFFHCSNSKVTLLQCGSSVFSLIGCHFKSFTSFEKSSVILK